MRPGMSLIVAQMRQYGSASRTDIFNDVTYWSDDQLEEIADDNSDRQTVRLLPSSIVGRTHFRLEIPRHYWFESDAYSILEVCDTPVPVYTLAVYEPRNGEIVFAEDLSETKKYMLEGRAVNLYAALAALWEQKAAQRADYADFKAGNNKVNMSQEYEHCVKRMAHYRNRTIRRYDRSSSGKWMS
jgi:hypothetical protein